MEALAVARPVDTMYSRSDAGRPAKVPKQGRTYTCSICQKTFKRSEHCSRHERSHTREKPFPCRHCGRRYGRKDIVLRHEKSFHALDHPKRQPPPQPQVETEDTIVVETSPPSSNPSPVVSKPIKEENIEQPRPAFEPEMSEEPLRDGHGLPLFHPSAFNNPPLQTPPTTLHPAFFPQNSYRQAPPAPNHEFHHAFSHYHAPPPPGMQHNTLDPRMFAPSNQQENQPPLDPLLQQYDEQRARKESIDGLAPL